MEPQPTRTDGGPGSDERRDPTAGPPPTSERSPAAEPPPDTEPILAAEPPPVGESIPAADGAVVSVEEASEPVPTSAVPPTIPVGPPAPTADGGGPARRGLGALGYVLAAIAGVALTAVVFVGAGAVSNAGPSPTPAPTFATTDATVGVASAPVTIQIWADYQCPYCGIFTHGIEPTVVRDYAATGRALVEFKDFAFLGQESIDAAVAAVCAGRQGRFWTYHDLVFASQRGENQGAFARPNLLSLATFAGLDAATFTTCLDDPTVAASVAAETEEGRGLGVESTPTLRITGPGGTKLLKGVTQPAAIAAAVDAVAKPATSPGAGQSSAPSGGPATEASPAPNATGGGVSPAPSASVP